MSNNILVTYTSNAGSTADVAQVVADALKDAGESVEVLPANAVQNLDRFDAVVVGGPLIMGWHKAAMNFFKANEAALSQKSVATFITCLNLTATDQTNIEGVPITLDTARAKPPKNPSKLSFPEKHGAPAEIIANITGPTPSIKLVSAGFFGGKLDFSRLNFFQKMFVRFLIRHPAGDFRDMDAIRTWAAALPAVLN